MKNEERSEIILDALGLLDDEMLEEVGKLRDSIVLIDDKKVNAVIGKAGRETERKAPPYAWRKWAALAASVCLLIAAGGLWQNPSLGEGDMNNMQDNIESTPEGELSGNVSQFPEFSEGENATTGMEDLFPSSAIASVSYLKDGSMEKTEILPEETEVFEKFLSVMEEGKRVTREEALDNPVSVYHLYVNLENGYLLQFKLLGNGYVYYSGKTEIYVRISTRVYDAVVAVLEGGN